MTDLGTWTEYLAEPDFLNWYSLPAELQAELDNYHPDGAELEGLSASQFAGVHQAAVRYANASVATVNPPYHGPHHFEVTEQQGMAAVKQLELYYGQAFPAAVKQALALALRLHDCHHCGSTFRIEARRPELLHRPDLGLRVSAEWVSAKAADQFGRQHDLPLPWRLFMTMIIWSSTYGGQTDRGQQLGIPNPQPQGLWGRLMRAADVYIPADFQQWMRQSIAVNYGEIPANPPAATWDGFIQDQGHFANYVEQAYDRLDEAADYLLTEALGWRANLRSGRHHLSLLAKGDRQLTAAVRAELAKYQVTLL